MRMPCNVENIVHWWLLVVSSGASSLSFSTAAARCDAFVKTQPRCKSKWQSSAGQHSLHVNVTLGDEFTSDTSIVHRAE